MKLKLHELMDLNAKMDKAEEKDKKVAERQKYYREKPIIDDSYLSNWIDSINQARVSHANKTEYAKRLPERVEALKLESLFRPYLSEVLSNYHLVNFTTVENFRNKFHITSNILDNMQEVWELYGSNAILAGGKLIDWFENKSNEESDNDYDVFFLGGRQLVSQKQAKQMENWKQIEHLSYLDEWEINGKKFQFINKENGEPETVIEDFDIRACSLCTNGSYIWWTKGSLQDIKAKRIVYTNPKSSINHFLRIQKYIDKGYTISCPDFMIASLKMLDKLLEAGLAPSKDSRYDKARYAIFDRGYEHVRDEFMYEGFSSGEGDSTMPIHISRFGAATPMHTMDEINEHPELGLTETVYLTEVGPAVAGVDGEWNFDF